MVRNEGQAIVRKRNPGVLSLSAVDTAAQRPAAVFVCTVIYIAAFTEKALSAERLYIHGHPVPRFYLFHRFSEDVYKRQAKSTVSISCIGSISLHIP